MLHPATELRLVSPDIGLGVFATENIPKGTIVYIKDPLEIEIAPDDPRLKDPAVAPTIERYSYIEPNGMRILSWDLAKYVNHSCNPNCISTGYGFEIAIRDIKKGEEITDDYGLFNVELNFDCYCDHDDCRKIIRANDLDHHHIVWDKKVRSALMSYSNITQPLAKFLDGVTRRDLHHFLMTGESYISVFNLKHDFEGILRLSESVA